MFVVRINKKSTGRGYLIRFFSLFLLASCLSLIVPSSSAMFGEDIQGHPYIETDSIAPLASNTSLLISTFYDPIYNMIWSPEDNAWHGYLDRRPCPPDGEECWTSPEGELCLNCGGNMFLEETILDWGTREFITCPKNPNYNDRVQQRQIIQSILCEYCRMGREQTYTETQTVCSDEHSFSVPRPR